MTAEADRSALVQARLNRRTLLGAGLGAGALLALRPLAGRAFPAAPLSRRDPAAWRTWLLASGAELRPHPEGTRPVAPTAAEIDELLGYQEQRTDAVAEIVARWGNGPAVLPWTGVALELIATHKVNPPRAARALALLHAALYDATVAALDAQAAYQRPAPAEAVAGLDPLDGAAARRTAFLSEHAVLAGAAAVVLTEVFPAEPGDRLAYLAAEAALSRLLAGAAFRSDVDAGLALGRAIGERAVTRARNDGSAAVWDGTRPEGEGVWVPTPPAFVDPPMEPLAGSWQTWVIPDVVAARPAPPPTYGSPAWQAELAAIREAVARRTPAQEEAALSWAGGPGTVTPGGLWVEIARDLILRDELDLPHAARVLALTSVALHDAFVCCWDAKFAYWMARPITADLDLNVLFPTPPFPSYTSGHSTISAAAAGVLGHLFPADEYALRDRAAEARDSRLWAGIHFPVDNEVGAASGAAVGRLVADYARHDGAE
jgi:hypothetical protein